jgi:hypothetical protein
MFTPHRPSGGPGYGLPHVIALRSIPTSLLRNILPAPVVDAQSTEPPTRRKQPEHYAKLEQNIQKNEKEGKNDTLDKK